MIYGSVYDSINESALYDVAPYEFDESMTFQEMGAQMIEEATQDWNNYMQAVALTELSYVIENHQEYIYEGVDISAMLGKVKEWFKKLWAKIQGIAKAAMAKFAQFAMSDDKFLSKYKSAIYDGAGKLPSGFSYKGYKFEGLKDKVNRIKAAAKDVIDRGELAASNMKSYGYGYSDQKDKDSSKSLNKKLDDYRAKLAGKTGSVSASEFKSAIKVDLYGSSDKEYIKTVDASKLVSIIEGANDAKTAAKEAQDAIKDDIDDKISKLNDVESSWKDKVSKSLEDSPEDTKDRDIKSSYASLANRYAQYLKDVETANATWFSAYITALKDQNRQAKAVCTKLISYANGVGGKKEPKTESVASLLEDRFAALEF